MSRTAAQDSILRLSMAMMAADTRARLPPGLCPMLIDRLQDHERPLSEAERAFVRDPLLAYITAYHPRILDIVSRQFPEHGAGEGPQGEAPPRRPSHHYGLVAERTTP